MKNVEVTRVTQEPKLKIWNDEAPESPRVWSNLGYFITSDSNYHSPDENKQLEDIISNTADYVSDQEEHMEAIKRQVQELMDEKVLAIYPVVKYEHGNVSYSLGTAHGFDHSNNGFYIITDKSIKECGTEEKLWEENIKGELETYTKWCNGEIYGFTLLDDEGETEDSCGGFYDVEDIREYLPKEWKDEDLEEYINY